MKTFAKRFFLLYDNHINGTFQKGSFLFKLKLERSKKEDKMKRFVVATHGKMAQGIQSTLELFVGSDLDVTYMSAYVDGEEEIETQIENFISGLKASDQAVVFTDMFGGSVNQKFVTASQDLSNIFIVAGINLPVMIEIIYGADIYTNETIQKLIESGRQAMQLNENAFSEDEDIDNIREEIIDQFEQPEVVETVNFEDTIPTTLRVDERLIHGQIAMVWSRELNLHGILVANDEVATNETQQMALKMAVPAGINVLIRTVDDVAEILKDPRAQKRRLLVLVRNVSDALRLANKVKNMSYINIGNVGKAVEGEKETLTQFVMLTPTELNSLKELVAIYPETALQNIPADKKELANTFIK